MKLLFFLIFSLICNTIFSQINQQNAPKPENLVKNHSFEQTTACPTDFDELEKAKFWKKYQGTPELMHSCCICLSHHQHFVPVQTA